MNMKRSFRHGDKAEEKVCDPWSIEYLYSIENQENSSFNKESSLPKKLAHVMHKWTWQNCASLTDT